MFKRVYARSASAITLGAVAIGLGVTGPSFAEDFDENVWEQSRELQHIIRSSGNDPVMQLELHEALHEARLEAHPPEAAEEMLSDDQVKLYRAAIQTGNCAVAERVFLDAYILSTPEVYGIRDREEVLFEFRLSTLSEHAPELRGCWDLLNARLAQRLITNDGLPVRPYTSSGDLGDDFGGGIYAQRNNNLSSLISTASLGRYAPGYVMFVRLDVDGQLVDIADDIALMLLRQAAAAWTDRDDRLSPIMRSEVDQLVSEYESRLNGDQLQRVDEVWDSDEALLRLHWGDEDDFVWLAEQEADAEDGTGN
ncbi:MAG: hypothetical protein AAFX39_04810 [Pseudomonadota bacterium]